MYVIVKKKTDKEDNEIGLSYWIGDSNLFSNKFEESFRFISYSLAKARSEQLYGSYVNIVVSDENLEDPITQLFI